MTPFDEIKRMYFNTTRSTILRDIDRAIDLLKTMDEEERDRAGVYMEGLIQMRGEWTPRAPAAGPSPGGGAPGARNRPRPANAPAPPRNRRRPR